jgi:recombinational DNA repair protein (RecF pathway)
MGCLGFSQYSIEIVRQLNLGLQDAHELFQIITSTLTSEEEEQYKEAPTSLFDVSAVRKLALEKNVGYIVNISHCVRVHYMLGL